MVANGSSTVERLSASSRPCAEADPRNGASSAPPPGYVSASSRLAIICSLKYMGQMEAWRMRNWERERAFEAAMLAKKDW